MDTLELRIEPLTTVDQFHACEALQRRAWRMDGDNDVVPLHLLVTFQRSGGLVLGAFDEQGEMVGTLFGFLGATGDAANRLKHCSHMMGVRADWRGRGVGQRLKLAQREHALRQGLDRVTWTYDPLESLNAALNIRKLGGVCNTYVRDLYGDMSDGQNADLGSDRFQLDWWIASGRIKERLAGTAVRPTLAGLLDQDAVLLNPAEFDPGGPPRPAPADLPPAAEAVLVEIPADIQSIKTADVALAQEWRVHTRAVFERCFAAEFTVVDFVSETAGDAESGLRRSFYVLRRGFKVD